jgi:hypothetical protein
MPTDVAFHLLIALDNPWKGDQNNSSYLALAIKLKQSNEYTNLALTKIHES